MKIRLKNPAVKKQLYGASVKAGEVFRFVDFGSPEALWLRTGLDLHLPGAVVSLDSGTCAHMEFSRKERVELVQGAFVEDGADE